MLGGGRGVVTSVLDRSAAIRTIGVSTVACAWGIVSAADNIAFVGALRGAHLTRCYKHCDRLGHGQGVGVATAGTRFDITSGHLRCSPDQGAIGGSDTA